MIWGVGDVRVSFLFDVTGSAEGDKKGDKSAADDKVRSHVCPGPYQPDWGSL